MKKSMLILTLMVAALCGCAAQQPTTLETPETSVMVEVTPETSSGATPTATPAPTPDPTPVPTAEPTATPTPTAAPTAKPTPAPTEAPAATAAPVQQAEASQQVSMSYGAVPFDLAAGTDQWWSIDSSDSAYWAVAENINAMRAAAMPHRFVGINQAGQVCLLQTQGNPNGHVILRGGKAPNYGPEDVAKCEKEMAQAGLKPSLMVDCSHGNSNKDFRRQPAVAESVVAQIKDGNRSIIGLMIESNIHEGNQSSEQPREAMKYGVSVTDACISWETTEALLFSGLTDDGQVLDQETCEKLMALPAAAKPAPLEEFVPKTLLDNSQQAVAATISGVLEANQRLFHEERDKLERWADERKKHLEYQIIHSHIDAMSYLPLMTAKKAGVPIRIAHSHNTSIDRDFKYPLKQLFRTQITGVANVYCACGKEAGQFLFGKRPFKVIPNAIEVDRFLYHQEVRHRVRMKLNLSGKYVVGHVGRLSYQKNHDYLIDIFEELYQRDQNARLLLIGTGDKEKALRDKVQKKALEEAVLFLGNREDVNELYQAMDIFVMPSFFEGIPVTGIEAQFSGLTCLFSDRVPSEVDFSGNCVFIPLSANKSVWVRKIMEERKEKDRLAKSQRVVGTQYNIQNAHSILEDYYKELESRIK